MSAQPAPVPAPIPRFVKISSEGARLTADAANWVAVLDTTTQLIWQREQAPKPLAWAKAKDYCAQLELAGAKDWRLPTVEELFALCDRSRVSPAIDTDYFPECDGGWYWSSTPYAGAAGCAWYVGLFSGSSNCYGRGLHNHVRAVRAGQSFGPLA